ncbi:MAG TPA: hypothetical protein VF244_01620 [Acidimicrobiales bacterium]
MPVEFHRNEAGIAYVTRSPFGPVGKDLRRRTVAVNIAAVRGAPVGRTVPADTWSRGHKGGALKRSIRSEVVTRNGHLVGRIGSDLPYAAAVVSGSRPHEIRPTRHRFLRWLIPPGYGEQRFARRVSHPGTRRPNPFLQRALREAQR